MKVFFEELALSEPIEMAYRKVSSPLARKVGELILLKYDLECSLECLINWQEDLPQGDANASFINAANQSFVRDAIITFHACFDSACPENLDASVIYADNPEALHFFNWCKDLRDTWVAHRFGPSRLAEAVFQIHPETGDVLGEGEMTVAYLGPPYETRDMMIRLAEHAHAYATSLLTKHRELLLDEVNSLFPNQRKKLDLAGFRIAGPEEFRMGRRKYRNVNRDMK